MKELTLKNLKKSNACDEIIEYYKKYLAKLKKSEDRILYCIKDNFEVLWLIWNGFITKRHEKMILDTGDAKSIYLFVRNVRNADKNKCLEAIINIGDAEYIYYFLKDVPGADINKCQDAIIASGDVEVIYWLITDIKGADIDKCQDAIKNYQHIDTSIHKSNNKDIKENISKVLKDRSTDYGDFKTHSSLVIQIMNILQEHQRYSSLPNPHKEAIHMIIHKIARCVNGNFNLKDNFTDIAGYALLVEKFIQEGKKND